MRVSSKAHYGLRMMIEFARAYGKGPMSLAEVSRTEHLPLSYLEQLAAQLGVPMTREGLEQVPADALVEAVVARWNVGERTRLRAPWLAAVSKPLSAMGNSSPSASIAAGSSSTSA